MRSHKWIPCQSSHLKLKKSRWERYVLSVRRKQWRPYKPVNISHWRFLLLVATVMSWLCGRQCRSVGLGWKTSTSVGLMATTFFFFADIHCPSEVEQFWFWWSLAFPLAPSLGQIFTHTPAKLTTVPSASAGSRVKVELNCTFVGPWMYAQSCRITPHVQ